MNRSGALSVCRNVRPESAWYSVHHQEENPTMGARMKTLIGLTAAGLCASALMPAVAQARPATMNFGFYNGSSAPEYVAFPYRGWWSSTIVNPGQTWQANLSGLDNDEAVGYRQVNGQWLAVATKYFSDNGANIMWSF
jgi:hypothetical protein